MISFNICKIEPSHTTVFSEIADILYYAAQDLGLSVKIEPFCIDIHAINIILGAHLVSPEIYEHCPAHTVILNTEQLHSLQGFSDYRLDWYQCIMQLAKRYQIWDYSLKNLHHLNQQGITHGKYLQLGYHPKLQRIKLSEQADIDVLFYGAINHRRLHILQQLQQYGLKVHVLTNAWGAERDAWVARSKVVLNMHYYDSYIFEIVRCFYLMNNGVAVVSEINQNTQIDPVYQNGIVAVPYEQLAETCFKLCHDDNLLRQQRQYSLQTIQQLPQAAILHQLLHQTFP